MRIFTLVLTGALLGHLVSAADDPFCGKWKLNAQKSSWKGLEWKIEDLGTNKYRLSLGSWSRTVSAHGTDQRGEPGTKTDSLKQEGPGTWRELMKDHGRVTGELRMMLSGGDTILTVHDTSKAEDGSTSNNTTEWKRIGTGTGLAGTWENTEAALGVQEMDIEPYERDGLSFITPSENIV